MIAIFYILFVLGIIIFFVRNRTFDFFTIAYISSIVYFLPGLFGYTFLPGWLKSELVIETYIVMCLIILSIIITSLIYDNNISTHKYIKYDFEKSNYIQHIIFLVTIISFIMMMQTMGSSLFLPDKKAILSSINTWSKIWENAVCIGAVLTYNRKKIKSFIFYLIMLAFIMYIGDRTIPAIALISIMTILFNNQGKQRLILSQYKLVITSLVFALFFFVYKYLYINIKLRMWSQVISKLLNPKFYFETIIYSEPFSIQTILNEVIKNDFNIGVNHFKGLLYQIIPFGNVFGVNNMTFNSLFQKQLFPDVTYGMGSNVWAEMWSAGGLILLLIFIIVFNSVIYIGNSYFQKSYGNLRILLGITLSFWTFYIHRSSLEYTINLNKRIFFLWMVSLIISNILSGFNKRKGLIKKVKV
jgi:hypothetical protein